MSAGYCDLKVVLLCKGPGADPSSFRPNRDDSQWWGRRDALVRCVSSFLYASHPNHGSKELVFLFDEDLAEMTMKVSNDRIAVPTEQTIVSLWKKAAQNLNTQIEANGMLCCIQVDPRLASKSSSIHPIGLDSKRQLLEYLQKECPIDFLRTKGLNSNSSVILRKTNKKTLVTVFNEWKKSSQNQSSNGKRDDQIEALYYKLLKASPKGQEEAQVVAATLHEKFQEFPCFGLDNLQNSSNRFSLVVFLGAVRDMSTNEHKILQNVCSRSQVPLVGVRFGIVPEFTSKILSILAFHHFHNSIGTAIDRLIKSNTGQTLPQSLPCKEEVHNLAVICTVPLLSNKVSEHLKDRCRTHWGLVRIIVCTLWRSRLVSSDFSVSHSSTLHLVFDDGIAVHLNEGEFVSKLASKHQAAPSEHQILIALKEQIEALSIEPETTSKNKAASRILSRLLGSLTENQSIILGIDPTGSNELSRKFYSEEDSCRSQSRNLIVMLDLDRTKRPLTEKPRDMYRAFLKAAKKTDVPFLRQSLVGEKCQDYEASSIVALQHFCYQNRLFVEDVQPRKKRKRSKS
eukprot:scaffold1278_cov191-Cylindrotheca_fusiformis.AAC.2